MTDAQQSLPLSPLRPAILTFVVDAAGLEYVRDMIDVMRARYDMTYEQALTELNERLGARDGREPAVIVWDDPRSIWWWHETPEHEARSMFEGFYSARERLARAQVDEWRSGKSEASTVHEHLGWSAEQYAKWERDGTLPPPRTADHWAL